ncbi:uncharacterized protein [Clytia hemisphaerica]|uniref:Uncharacterized protein n=1 Tax=Clytia hemisphaerica TaxID=252671 RepID=A0A7M6DMI9_9CNID
MKINVVIMTLMTFYFTVAATRVYNDAGDVLERQINAKNTKRYGTFCDESKTVCGFRHWGKRQMVRGGFCNSDRTICKIFGKRALSNHLQICLNKCGRQLYMVFPNCVKNCLAAGMKL